MQRHLSSQFSGRLLGLILCELGRHEPEVFCAFLERIWRRKIPPAALRAIAAGEAQFLREYPFVAGRFADVAVLLAGEPILLIEIKEEDVDAPGNPAQHADYLRWVDRESKATARAYPAFFLHLSRYFARKALPEARSEQVGAAYYSDLYAVVARGAAEGGQPLSQMITDYLEDIGVAAYRTIDLESQHKALTFLGVQMLGFDEFAGFGKLKSGETATSAVPLLEILLGNATVFGEWLRAANGDLFKQTPLARFKTSVGCKEGDLRRVIDSHDEPGEAITIPARKVQEGYVSIYSTMKVGGPMRDAARGWLYVSVGFVVGLERQNKEGAQIALFVEIASDQDQDGGDETDWLDEFPTEEQALKLLAGCLARAKRDALKKASGAHAKVIGDLKIPKVTRGRA